MEQRYSKTKPYKAVIFDVDGTLYFQPRLRLKMAMALAGYFIFHLHKIKDLKIIATFRSFREHYDFSANSTNTLETEQYAAVASKLSVSENRVRSVINTWMYQKPLEFLPSCRDNALFETIAALQSQGIVTAVYSDYPVDDKLKALGIQMDYTFCATDKAIQCLKPNPKGIKAVLETLGFSADECLLIGDRYEKDGKSAQSVGMDYLILSSDSKKRCTIEMNLPTVRPQGINGYRSAGQSTE